MIMRTCPQLNSEGLIVSPVYREETQAYLSNIWMMNFALNIPCTAIPFIRKGAVEIHMFKKQLKIERMSMKKGNKRLLSGVLPMRRLKRYLRLACLNRLL
jgi:hypothetical protein